MKGKKHIDEFMSKEEWLDKGCKYVALVGLDGNMQE